MERRTFIRLSGAALAGYAWSAVAGCGSSGGSGGGGNNVGPPSNRGQVASTIALGTFTRKQMDAALNVAGLGALTPTRYDVDAYQVDYYTPDYTGQLVRASGLVAIPRGATSPRPLLTYFHGTTTVRTDVPSSPVNLEGQLVTAAYAAAGYIAVAPDYLGLGSSPTEIRQTFEMAGPLATASVDMLRAAHTMLAEQGAVLNARLFLTGISEGGYTTMAVQRAIESQYATEFTITASAPVAGAYDLSGTTFQAALASPSGNTPAYIAGLLYGYKAVYPIYNAESDVFLSPYAGEIDLLFDGTRPLSAIRSILPPTPQGLLKPDFLGAIQSDPNHPLRVALRANDVFDWKNTAPIRLYHGEADKDVPFANATIAQQRMTQLGGDVQVVDLGADVGHADAVVPATIKIRAWFDSLANL